MWYNQKGLDSFGAFYSRLISDSKTSAFLFFFQTTRERTRKHWAITSMRCAGREEQRETEGRKKRWRKRRRKGMVLGERSAQPPITRCQRRQAVIRRLNSRSSRSVFVRVNLHQVSIFRAFRSETRGERMLAAAAAAPLRRAKSTVTTAVINNTSKNNGENIENGRSNVARRLKVTPRETVSLTCAGKHFNDKFSDKLGVRGAKMNVHYIIIVSFFALLGN